VLSLEIVSLAIAMQAANNLFGYGNGELDQRNVSVLM
jgi:hypothetical protein